MNYFEKIDLQLFAEGADGGADAGAEGVSSGENSADAAQQKLLELGVPKHILERRAKRARAKSPAPSVTTEKATDKPRAAEQVAAADDSHPEEDDTNKDTQAADKDSSADKTNKPTWDELMKDPDYNSQMQATIRARLKNADDAEKKLTTLAPALEVLARQHGLDMENIDYDALAKAIEDDDAFYEKKSLELGVSNATAKKLDQDARRDARNQRIEAENQRKKATTDHFLGLRAQEKEFKKMFPNFDLETELKNPTFARMTAPGVNLSIEDAYFAVHRKELQRAAMETAAKKTAAGISNSIQSQQRRPNENGTSAKAPSAMSFNYRNATPQQRAAVKQQIRAAAQEGRTLYPEDIKF